MRKTNLEGKVSLLLACLVLVLSSCQAAKATPATTLGWLVQVSKSEIKASLQSVEAVTQYDGSKLDVTHALNPGAGNVYLLIDVTIRKTEAPSTASFDWQMLAVRDASGNSYQRISNDTFLEQFQYSPRITSLALRLGDYNGWMAFELPVAAAQGKLILAYTGEGSQQEFELHK